jgi:hypothetical protein
VKGLILFTKKSVFFENYLLILKSKKKKKCLKKFKLQFFFKFDYSSFIFSNVWHYLVLTSLIYNDDCFFHRHGNFKKINHKITIGYNENKTIFQAINDIKFLGSVT